MNFLAILRVAARALGRNKLRTALTMLGIIIGVGAVIVLVSICQGAQSMLLQAQLLHLLTPPWHILCLNFQ